MTAAIVKSPQYVNIELERPLEKHINSAGIALLSSLFYSPTSRVSEVFAVVQPQDFWNVLEGELYEICRAVFLEGDFNATSVLARAVKTGWIGTHTNHSLFLTVVANESQADCLQAAELLLQLVKRMRAANYGTEVANCARYFTEEELEEAVRMTAPLGEIQSRLTRIRQALGKGHTA